jgi:hypothetical protein
VIGLIQVVCKALVAVGVDPLGDANLTKALKASILGTSNWLPKNIKANGAYQMINIYFGLIDILSWNSSLREQLLRVHELLIIIHNTMLGK